MEQRETLIYNAKLSEQCDRYDEMAKIMKEVSEKYPKLSKEERNLLSVSYKNIVGQRRSSWRVISSIEEKTAESSSLAIVKKYKACIEKELKDLCKEVLGILERLIPGAEDEENKVFYFKLKGDYYRYLAEFSHGQEHKEEAENGNKAYKEGTELAVKSMSPTDPIRLGLHLNHSVFYKEILDDSDAAVGLAKKALEEAMDELDKLGEDAYKDSTLIMQLLKDNLSLWKTEVDDNEEDGPKH
ncbi:14-3-3 protein epsilon [Nematostella vectensis]|uniref:14-3-3 protein epsilon n=1 Tax=Nematostella vectensis TaxID=45351 RepID=UPI00139042D8|nr:14-3-3 protein epsilon [Nematostella vectensis]